MFIGKWRAIIRDRAILGLFQLADSRRAAKAIVSFVKNGIEEIKTPRILHPKSNVIKGYNRINDGTRVNDKISFPHAMVYDVLIMFFIFCML